MRKKLTIVANWKMNLDLDQAKTLAKVIGTEAKHSPHTVGIAPSFPFLLPVSENLQGSGVLLSSQNVASTENGAYTGEVSASQLKDLGVQTVLVGHSERREYFQESDAIVQQKIKIALDHGLGVILCVGESLELRERGDEESFVLGQIKAALDPVSAEQLPSICIAYEPIWAIGTGKTASAAEAERMHVAIRECIATLYTKTLAEDLSIIYGGSVKSGNASELFTQPNIDGALVGGSSLKMEEFTAILKGKV